MDVKVFVAIVGVVSVILIQLVQVILSNVLLAFFGPEVPTEMPEQ
ncbi:hypothetical protein [Candidatus Absconditicoccus praedator]|nr:hypothetical protein [Candidatus Absconditicoccus praedator]